MRRSFLIVILVASAAGILSPSAQGQSDDVGVQSVGCTYNFTSTHLTWCVNEHGNLQQFESPAGAEHIAFGLRPEGYILCEDGDLEFFDTAVQHDFTLGPPQVLAGPTASSVTIRRSTTNGRWQFDQKWTQDKTERDLTLQMTLQNLGAAATNVRLLRVVDIDANSAIANFYDAGRYSAVFRNIDTVAVTALTLTESPSVEIFAVAGGGITYCDPPSAAVPGTTGDPKAYIIYDLGNINTGKKKVVRIGYRAM